MKKRLFVIISILILVSLLIFTSPVQALYPTAFVGHNFGEEYFAIEVDLVGECTSVFDSDPENPDLIHDLLDAGATTGDSNPLEDVQFYIAYMNMSGMETVFSALEKFEHILTFKDFVSEQTYDDIWAVGALVPSLRDALEAPMSTVNSTAPFQQLVQHYTTSEASGYRDVFVANNFMALIAYSTGTGSDPNLMDENDDLYLGYTFAIQNLTDVINDALVVNGHSDDQIGYYNYESSFEKTATGYKFGIKYTNLLIFWQAIDIAPKTIDVFTGTDDHSEYLNDDTGGVVFGHEIVAASVLDYLSFDYIFETMVFTGANEYIEGRVTTEYDIGETNLLITRDSAAYIVDNAADWNLDPFTGTFSYTLTIPDALADIDFTPYGLPDVANSVTVDLPELAFFVDDDAKVRMRKENGFGLTVAAATTSFGLDVVDPEYELVGDDINLNMGGETYFYTEYTGKKTYKLLGLEGLWGIDPTIDQLVEVIPFDPSGWGVADFEITKVYFATEFSLAYGFTKFMAKELGEFIAMSGSPIIYVTVDLLYFTFTEFPKWYGGEIIYDAHTYSVVAASSLDFKTTITQTSEIPRTTPTTSTSAPSTSSTTTEATQSSSITSIRPSITSGFSVTLIIMTIFPVLILHHKRDKNC